VAQPQQKPVDAQGAPQNAAAEPGSSKLHKPPSKQSSRGKLTESGSKKHRPPSRTPSGKEGRHGFVPLREGSLGSKRGSTDIAGGAGGDEPLEGGDRFFQKVLTTSQKTGEVLSEAASKASNLLQRISLEHHCVSPQPPKPKDAADDEDNQPDFVLNVLFVLKKALEFRDSSHITQHALAGTVDAILASLDPGSSGVITTGSLIAYIQSTCAHANQEHGSQHGSMVVPSVDQITLAFQALDIKSKDSVSSAELKAALMGMDWGLLPA